jgi:hypothetical protein
MRLEVCTIDHDAFWLADAASEGGEDAIEHTEPAPVGGGENPRMDGA